MMEMDELKDIWTQHEKMLSENTRMNKELLKKILLVNATKRIDWLKIKSLAGLILPFLLLVFIVIPRLHFTFEPEVLIGFLLFIPLYVLSYVWTIKLYLRIERLNPGGPITTVRKQLRIVEKYKLKITKNSLILAPFMIIGIFLSAGIPFFSTRMIPFYALMVLSFLVGTYVRTKHGLIAQVRKIDSDIEEITKLEAD